jgi:hypothetical protein
MIDKYYIELLVNKKSPIKKDKQIEIINNLFDCFVQYGKDMLYITEGYIYKVCTRKAFEITAYQHLVKYFEGVKIKSYDEDKNRDKWNIKISDIYDTITVRNSYDLLVYKSDLFLSQQKVEKDDLTKTITVTTNKLHIREIEEPTISKVDYIEIVKDYKKHFPYFDELLKLVIDMRLAKNRKASFLHLRVKSDWGKSFLSGLFQNLEIGFEIDYHNLMNKGANDIAPIQVRNSFVLLLDEFNNFSSEMKKLSHDFKFAPKFGMTEKVELYLKILFSAEKSPSFSGGVDDQIVNRVMVMDIEDDKSMKLTERKIYLKHGNAKYMSALERYAYLKLRKYLDEYLNMDRFEAHKKADNEVRNTLEKYKMKDVANLNDETKSVINETIHDILDSDEMTLNPKFRDIKNNIIKIETGVYIGKVFIKQAKRTFETILKNTVSESEFKKMKWKLSDLNSIVNIVVDSRNKTISIGSKKMKGLVININEDSTKKTANEIIQDLKESGNFIDENSQYELF